MNRFSNLIAVLTVLVFGLVTVNAYAGGMKSMSWGDEMTGKIVRNFQGEYLGQIGDVIHEPDGSISLVALNQYPTFGTGGSWRRLAIPFDALKYDSGRGYYVLEVTKEKLASAPDFRVGDVHNRDWVEGVYKFYGVQPSWTGGSSSEMMGHPMEGSMDMEP